MKPKDNIRISDKTSAEDPQAFHFYVLESNRLRYLNSKAINLLSRLLINLFADYYPTLKH